MRVLRTVLFSLVISLCVASSSWALGCLTPTGPVIATVSSEGVTATGLESLLVVVEGFELIDLQAYNVGCTIGLSLESMLVPAPSYLLQRRAITNRMLAVDVENPGHFIGFTLGVDYDVIPMFNYQASLYGPFGWPTSVAFIPLSNRFSTPTAPVGPVELRFSVVVRSGYEMSDILEDLQENGYVASDFSVQANGNTYLLWTSIPFLTRIDEVVEK